MKKRIVVGMSGGVDSSVAALLLKEQGFDVIGLFMNNWEDDGVCTAAEDWEDARAVAAAIGVPIYSVNLSEQYRERVFSYFLREYAAGRTPNPDVMCNREIKFGPFRFQAQRLGAELIATGHYCGLSPDFTKVDVFAPETVNLLTAADGNKDQTYFLNQVTTEQLRGVVFPLSNMKKSEVREIAVRRGLVTGKKKDSTGICFIGERNFRPFLKKFLPAQPGEIVTVDGKIVGRHDGLMYYTLGQRRGLGIGGVKGENPERWYVVEKDLKANRLIVSCGEGEELLSCSLTASELNIIGDFDFPNPLKCSVKTRYRQPAQPATVTFTESGFKCEFESPQRAVTQGQYAVIYLGGRCIGGGVIDSVS